MEGSLSNSCIDSTDPCLGFRMRFFFLVQGHQIQVLFLFLALGFMALCNQLAHSTDWFSCSGDGTSGLWIFFLKYLVKEIHAGSGLNTESFKCLLCRTSFGESFPQLPSLRNADCLRLYNDDSLRIYNGDSLRLSLLIKTWFFIIEKKLQTWFSESVCITDVA